MREQTNITTDSYSVVSFIPVCFPSPRHTGMTDSLQHINHQNFALMGGWVMCLKTGNKYFDGNIMQLRGNPLYTCVMVQAG